MANTYLTRTASAGNQKTFTISVWLKRSQVNTTNYNTIFSSDVTGNNSFRFTFNDDDGSADDKLMVYYYTGSHQLKLITNRQFRDVSAWYHIVLAVDTTQATSSDRVKIYVNGVQETSFSTATYPSQNLDTSVNENSAPHEIGRGGGSLYYDGSMSHFHFIDGTAYDPTAFGEYDANGVWKIKTDVSVTYGTNGFFILKDGNSVTDQSGEGNNFTVAGGTLTNTEDNPSNVFATGNALSCGSDIEFLYGNTRIRNDQSANSNALSTIALGNGKYYWENYRHGGGNIGCGITLSSVDGSNHGAIHNFRVHYYEDGNIYIDGFLSLTINTGVTYGDTDIIGVSVDTENGTIKFYKNGTLVNNSTITNSVFTYSQNELIPFWYVLNGGEWRANMGNGYFGTTAVSSAGTNASGIGIFEYDVPTGYTALSTKGLNL